MEPNEPKNETENGERFHHEEVVWLLKIDGDETLTFDAAYRANVFQVVARDRVFHVADFCVFRVRDDARAVARHLSDTRGLASEVSRYILALIPRPYAGE